MPRISPYSLPFLLLGSLLSLVANAAQRPDQPTHEFKLDNGLNVIVREDHRAPVVVSQLWYKVGSSYETSGTTGLSHMLEHMMFKGSRHFGPGEASQWLRELGAKENAFTSADYTAYYQVLARDRLEIALELEADRLAGLRLPADEFAKELEVVKEERRLRTEDRPSALAYERFKTLAYLSSGYRHPTIGWMADIERLNLTDLRAWYQRWYTPSNATLVIVGDVHLEEVRPLVERHFGPLPSTPAPQAKQPLELDEPGQRQLQLSVQAQLPSLLMAFNVPGLSTAEDPTQIWALQLISALLDGGYSARLPTRLERDQALVTNISAWYDPYTRGDTLFVLGATPNVQQGHDLTTVQKAITQELANLAQTPPSQEELDRVRAQVIANLVFERDSITQQAMAIGRLESVGLSWKLMDQELEALEQVTAADIQQAAQRFFTPTRQTIAHVLPQENTDEQ